MEPQRPVATFFLMVLLLIIALPSSGIAGEIHKVARVIDGDTIKLSNGERVRYIGRDYATDS